MSAAATRGARHALRLAAVTTIEVEAALAGGAPVVVLLPVGSVEPHGPHLPLGTDTIISEAAIERASARLGERGYTVLVAPAVAYGVTDFASGFAGAVSVPGEVLAAYLVAIARAFLDDPRVTHLCLVNNHLEPEHDAAVRAAAAGVTEGGIAPHRISVACPLTRRWARTLGDEFKRGECHAGRYETSIVLAAAAALVDTQRASGLPRVAVSLSEEIRAGRTRFAAMGMDAAYAGAPAEASSDEGHVHIERLAEMIEAEVHERIGAATVIPG